MAEPRKELDPLDEIARLLAVLVRRDCESQTEAITEIARVGIGARRIGELLGTSPNTVNVTLQKAKKKERGASGG